MNLCDVTDSYKDEKLYNIIEVAEKFKDYFGFSLEELESYFGDYKIIAKEEMIDTLKQKYNKCNYLEEVVNNRVLEYDYYAKVLKILSYKAVTYLSLIKYLCDCKEKDNCKEKLLEEIEIYHYSSIVTGKDINRILIVLFHLLRNFNSTLKDINKQDDFLAQRISFLGTLQFDQEELYPSEKLIIIDDYCLDKTSLNVKRRTR